MRSQIVGTGMALPRQVMTSQSLGMRLGLTEAQIEKRCGIRTRYWVGEGETTSSLALSAAKMALQSADLPASALDLILVSTSSPDMFFPSVACLVQKGLNARLIPAFDLNASCSGFLYALSVADQAIQNRSARRVLIVSAEVKSSFIDKNDPATAILFGDGAAAAVLAPGRRGLRSMKIYAEGSRHRLIYLPAGGSRIPASTDSLKGGLHTMKMEGKALFRQAVKKMEMAAKALAEEAPLSEIDLFLFHQANFRIIEAVLKKLEIPASKSHLTIQKYGNTSSSALPIALDDAIRSGRLKRGDRLALMSFGGGLTWGWALMDW